ncbi:S-adenosyl-L-methionine-dependent methyltransferase [Xylariomycetidae sp. FL2044]|nr:S-adenosyl-L-methionine-dependent methyltransferase [Xylariomycetidae sp. FL2044]
MAPPPEYVFTRDYIDNNRINLQHYQWIDLFGYHLHPTVPTADDSALRIADVATGTGIFLTDLSTRLPSSTQLDGFDVSLDATPPTEWLPHNVRFRHWDIRQPVPEDLVEAYDIVHIRLLAFVLQDHEVPQVLDNVIRMIKPGGYLQWAEADVPSFRIEKTHPENKQECLTQLLKVSQPRDARLSPTWVAQLSGLFSASGLSVMQVDKRDASGYLALAMHECNLMLHELLARSLANQTMGDQLRELLPKVAEETRNGACWAFTRVTILGQKPA